MIGELIMNRYDIIQKIGSKYHIGNMENDVFRSRIYSRLGMYGILYKKVTLCR